SLDLLLGNPCVLEFLLHEVPEAYVLVQPLLVVLLLVPAGVPGADDAEPKPDRMRFLTHLLGLLELEHDVRRPLVDARRPSHGAGEKAADGWTLIYLRLADDERVDVDVALLAGVRDRGLEH